MVSYQGLFGLFLPASILLTGCGNLAPYALNQPSVNVEKVLAEIQCALDRSVSQYEKANTRNKWIREWSIAFELTSDLTNTGEIGLSTLDWSIPYSPYPLSLGLLGKLTRANQDKIVYKYKLNLNNLKCPNYYYQYGTSAALNKSVSALGFDRIFGTAQWVRENSGEKKLPTFSYRRQFTLTTEGVAKPGFHITNLSGSANGRLARANINTLDMAFAGPPPPDVVAHVIVDNLPGGGKKHKQPVVDSDRLDRILENGLNSLKNEPAY
ncbi:hypothetical protein EN943_21720 [Mesorhizobium sp. M7A.F.Ca.US.006.01.1.1]|uniref:hypothetical protein n=1 Tax=Mesorhizobium sp. M7A.F.Ca.US.006.01.1.1 TaxID=2496707 RepID=UPI000FCC9134|nr:hypothetical protein [Mesorhizobium sp. M7A.F.Ca.US.006.01.1.1]RUZ75097.1 hypothetical protein EN943_21720 [Mesorhizobium sp. M7A.F.Ca.US.006.01.1.1]